MSKKVNLKSGALAFFLTASFIAYTWWSMDGPPFGTIYGRLSPGTWPYTNGVVVFVFILLVMSMGMFSLFATKGFKAKEALEQKKKEGG